MCILLWILGSDLLSLSSSQSCIGTQLLVTIKMKNPWQLDKSQIKLNTFMQYFFDFARWIRLNYPWNNNKSVFIELISFKFSNGSKPGKVNMCGHCWQSGQLVAGEMSIRITQLLTISIAFCRGLGPSFYWHFTIISHKSANLYGTRLQPGTRTVNCFQFLYKVQICHPWP